MSMNIPPMKEEGSYADSLREGVSDLTSTSTYPNKPSIYA